jgi:surface protein
MHQMFSSTSKFTSDLNGWNVSRVTSMRQMFSSASEFTSDLNAWDVSRVASMYQMFHSASAFTSDLNAWDVWATNTIIDSMFQLTALQRLPCWYSDDEFKNASMIINTTFTTTTAPFDITTTAGTTVGVTVGVLVMLGAVVALVVYRPWRTRSSGERAFADNSQWAIDPQGKIRNTRKVVFGRASKLAVQIADVVRERAEARFVIEYRQLVAEDSMEAFQSTFRELEVPRAAVSVGAALGRGQSGVVFAGVWNSTAVAIKTREIIDVSDIVGAATVADEALLLEALLLKGLRHPAIVSLVAVVTKAAPIFVCIELMENGDLREFLRGCRPKKASSQSISPTIMPRYQQRRAKITPPDMTLMAAKLGSAMAFLEQNNIIHRDVAARNVLVGATAIDVKLADLGAARSVHRISEISNGGVYTATSDHTPARWMPLEALREAKFSHKSDVFAFGVLLWEILSMGKTPWGAFGVEDFTSALVRGKRMPCPAILESGAEERGEADVGGADAKTNGFIAAQDLVENIYAVAVRCWTENPEKRPHFHQLEAEFAIHETVLVAQARQRGRTISEATSGQLQANHVDDDGYLRPTSPGDDSEGESAGAMSALDGDGYVADESFNRREVLDADGYVADESFSKSGDIAKENETRLNAAGDVDAALPREAVVALPTAGVLVDPKTAAVHGVKPRCGIAPRRDRKPSVYNGFGDGDGDHNVSQKNSPLPQTQAAVATSFLSPATRGPNEITRRTYVKPSLDFGFDQSIGRMPLPDETRL